MTSFSLRTKSAILLFVLLPMACFSLRQTHASEGTCEVTLSSSLKLEESSFTPVNMSFTPVLRVGREYLGTLVRYNGTAEVSPSLAQSWTLAPDNRSITFHLDTSCRWSDGAPITGQQFVAGFRSLFDPSTSFTGNSGYAHLSEMIKGGRGVRELGQPLETLGLHAPDEQTFVIETDGPADLLLEAFIYQSYTPLPTHWIDSGKMKWPSPDIWRVSSGPYVVSAVESSEILLQRNPFYCSSQPVPIKTARYLLDTPRQATVGLFLNGKIDGLDRYSKRIVAPLLNNSEQIRKFKITAPKGSPDRVFTYLFVNQTLPALQDPRVKEAISLLIEYEFIASEPLMGATTRILSGLTLPVSGYNGPVLANRSIPYEARVSKARALMEEAGYSNDRKLVIDLPLRENHEFYSLGQAVAGMLSKGYFEVQTRPAGEGEKYYSNLDERNFGVGLFLWGTLSPDPQHVLRGIIDKRITDEETHKSYHQLFAASLEQDTMEKRHQILLDLERRLTASGHIIPVSVVTRTFVVAEEFRLGDGVFLQAANLEPVDPKACIP